MFLFSEIAVEWNGIYVHDRFSFERHVLKFVYDLKTMREMGEASRIIALYFV